MQSQEQQLIESLFDRLKQAETHSGPRDATAETLIQQQIQRQPGAPYYMAQSILIQEAALKQLNNRISELEARLAQQPPQQSSGGFLSGLFGAHPRQQPAAQQPSFQNSAQQQAGWNGGQQPSGYAPAQTAAPTAGRGFLGGALQTAVGVAGGVVMADMLTSLFHHAQPEEIVNIINEPAQPQDPGDTGLDNLNRGDGLDTFNGNSGQDTFNDYASQDSFNEDSGDDFGDDDSFV